MSTPRVEHTQVDERRRFERIDVPFDAQVYVTDRKNHRCGIVRQLGRGGIMLEPEMEFKAGKNLYFTIIDDSEKIRIDVDVVVRYADSRFVGCEFLNLSAEAAVELGILIGKYYSSEKR